MTRFIRRLVLLPLLGLAQCGILPPFQTAPPPNAKGDVVAVCYNWLTTTAEAVRAIATEGCDPGTTPQAIDRDMTLENCPIFVPVRVTFMCAKP